MGMRPARPGELFFFPDMDQSPVRLCIEFTKRTVLLQAEAAGRCGSGYSSERSQHLKSVESGGNLMQTGFLVSSLEPPLSLLSRAAFLIAFGSVQHLPQAETRRNKHSPERFTAAQQLQGTVRFYHPVLATRNLPQAVHSYPQPLVLPLELTSRKDPDCSTSHAPCGGERIQVQAISAAA
ncbi:homeobox protein Hox-A2 [Platysternon megacephalum]|uniref:Homeobox protein Hox-A2 n=1 Tax=Platysternon megacephalum TaxID=55544 RepID=A0A4D9ER20_9SAUR|nr:homeobox protein Hox-A2 [Platysternon megacephalum]